jgi:hypothetical protein
MTDYQRETAFLRQVILYDDTIERQNLDERLEQAQRDEGCVGRAAWLMVFLTALSLAGLCYSAILLTNYSQNVSQFVEPFIIKVFCAVGLGSLICLALFMGLGVAYRKKLDQRREECRRFAAKVLESRLGKPRTMPLPGVVQEQDLVV